jgi:hypothetical protein
MKFVSSLFAGMLATTVAIATTGCAADAASDTDDLDLEPMGETSSALGSTIDVPNPSGAYFAKVSANGTGCPAGTWDASISGDGKAFTVTFSAYEAIVEPGAALSIKDCTIGLDLRTFSVSKFHYQGYALLDKRGMTARQTAKYYFQGNPVPARELRSDMNGPYDRSYVFSDTIGVSDLVWSACGESRRLNAQTRLVLRNNSAKTGSGYLNTSSVDGTVSTPLRFVFWLNWRRC